MAALERSTASNRNGSGIAKAIHASASVKSRRAESGSALADDDTGATDELTLLNGHDSNTESSNGTFVSGDQEEAASDSEGASNVTPVDKGKRRMTLEEETEWALELVKLEKARELVRQGRNWPRASPSPPLELGRIDSSRKAKLGAKVKDLDLDRKLQTGALKKMTKGFKTLEEWYTFAKELAFDDSGSEVDADGEDDDTDYEITDEDENAMEIESVSSDHHFEGESDSDRASLDVLTPSRKRRRSEREVSATDRQSHRPSVNAELSAEIVVSSDEDNTESSKRVRKSPRAHNGAESRGRLGSLPDADEDVDELASDAGIEEETEGDVHRDDEDELDSEITEEGSDTETESERSLGGEDNGDEDEDLEDDLNFLLNESSDVAPPASRGRTRGVQVDWEQAERELRVEEDEGRLDIRPSAGKFKR
ncbi:hypothetical protein HDU93_006203 [Gonapodya sp. JEL0774]|nr:hypothetical protein HDU93_006203 [Gonapodya sp. JEL0774]